MSALIALSCTRDDIAPYVFSDLDFGPAIELRPIWPEETKKKTQAFQLVVTAQPEDDRLHPAVLRGMIEITAVNPPATRKPQADDRRKPAPRCRWRQLKTSRRGGGN